MKSHDAWLLGKYPDIGMFREFQSTTFERSFNHINSVKQFISESIIAEVSTNTSGYILHNGMWWRNVPTHAYCYVHQENKLRWYMWRFNTTQFLILASRKYIFILWRNWPKPWDGTKHQGVVENGLNCPLHLDSFIWLFVQHINLYLV